MLEVVKKALRVDGNEHDGEVQDLIDGVVADLTLAGVAATKAQDMDDPLIRRAVITYCRANFDYADNSADRLLRSYETLKAHLSMADDYREAGKA